MLNVNSSKIKWDAIDLENNLPENIMDPFPKPKISHIKSNSDISDLNDQIRILKEQELSLGMSLLIEGKIEFYETFDSSPEDISGFIYDYFLSKNIRTLGNSNCIDPTFITNNDEMSFELPWKSKISLDNGFVFNLKGQGYHNQTQVTLTKPKV